MLPGTRTIEFYSDLSSAGTVEGSLVVRSYKNSYVTKEEGGEEQRFWGKTGRQA